MRSRTGSPPASTATASAPGTSRSSVRAARDLGARASRARRRGARVEEGFELAGLVEVGLLELPAVTPALVHHQQPQRSRAGALEQVVHEHGVPR